MLILFPCDPLSPRQVEDDFSLQWNSAQTAGFDVALLDFDALTRENNSSRAMRLVPSFDEPQPALIRGWMVTPQQYAALFDALQSRGITLVTTPNAYKHAHWLPENFAIVAAHSPFSLLLPQESFSDENLRAQLREFGGGPLIVKDFVKSRKHDWHEACFIPDAADETAALRVIHRFVELQGEQLQGGIVLRRFAPLDIIGEHPRSKMPLGCEWRIFVWDGAPFFVTRYWPEVKYDGAMPDLLPFMEAMGRVQSRFFTMDIARTEAGQWIILEIGDGQVSGLPEDANVSEFYNQLKKRQV